MRSSSTFYAFQPEVDEERGVLFEPELPESTSFTTGARIRARLSGPLLALVNHTKKAPPRHFLGERVPIFSEQLLSFLRKLGVANLQDFPAVLRNSRSRTTWTGYHAVNVVGSYACADLKRSTYVETEGDAPGETGPLDFAELVIAAKKAPKELIFRLAESPDVIIARKPVVDALREHRAPGGWGITVVHLEHA